MEIENKNIGNWLDSSNEYLDEPEGECPLFFKAGESYLIDVYCYSLKSEGYPIQKYPAQLLLRLYIDLAMRELDHKYNG